MPARKLAQQAGRRTKRSAARRRRNLESSRRPRTLPVIRGHGKWIRRRSGVRADPASRAGRSEERRAELSTPVGRAGILGTEHLKQVDEFLAVVVVELHGGQQRSVSSTSSIDSPPVRASARRWRVVGLSGILSSSARPWSICPSSMSFPARAVSTFGLSGSGRRPG